MPTTLSRVASFSKAASDLSGLPVSSSLTRSTSMPFFFRSSIARVTPFVRFSPMGASDPVIELMNPSLTEAAAATAGTANSAIMSSATSFFITTSFEGMMDASLLPSMFMVSCFTVSVLL